MRYSDDRIDAVEYEGRKYRSRTLLTKAMRESDERDRNVRAGQEVLKKGTGQAFNLIAYLFEALLFLGLFVGLLDMDKGYMPLWLAIVLVVVGAVGFFLVIRLRDRLRREADCEVVLGKKDIEKIEKEAAAYHAKIDAGWHAIISKPGIQPHEAFMQYEEFLKNEEAKRKRQAFWGMGWGSIAPFVVILGLFAFVSGSSLWSSLERGENPNFWTLVHFVVHVVAIVGLLVYGLVRSFMIKPQADALPTPEPVPRRRSEAPFEAARRAANINAFWRMGGAGERVPFEAAQPLSRNR